MHLILDGSDNLPECIFRALKFRSFYKYKQNKYLLQFDILRAKGSEIFAQRCKEYESDINYIKEKIKKQNNKNSQKEKIPEDIDIFCNLIKEDAINLEFLKKIDRTRLRESEHICLCLKHIIETAVAESIELYKENKNMIAPFWHIDYGNMGERNWAMPLFISHQEKPDCAVVFNDGGEIRTILNIDEVTRNVRVFNDINKYDWLRKD